MRRLRELFLTSFFYNMIQQIQRFTLIRLMFEEGAFSALWYESAAYRVLTFHIKKLIPHIPKAYISYDPRILGAFLAFIFLVPSRFWSGFWLSILLIPTVLFISNSENRYSAESLLLVFCAEGILIALLLLMLPWAAVLSLVPLMIAIMLFFLLQYSVSNLGQLHSLLLCLLFLVVGLCCMGLIQSYHAASVWVCATFSNSESFAEILVLFFPFAMAAALSQKSKSRRMIYSILLLLLSFRTILATGSKAGLIGYSVELLLLLTICNPRYLFLVVFLTPAVTNSAVGRILDIWHSRPMYGNFFVTVATLAQDIWRNGFGMSSQPFLELYTNTILNNAAPPQRLAAPVAQGLGYLRIVLELGFVAFFLFLWYVLRLARSTILSIFTAGRGFRPVFAAGLSALIGISLSALFSYTLLQPRNLLAYFIVIGILAAANRLKIQDDTKTMPESRREKTENNGADTPL